MGSPRVPRLARLGLALALALALGPAAAAQTLVDPVRAEGLSGRELFQRDCAFCHGPAGEGTPVAPPVARVGEAGAHYWIATGRMPIADPDEDPQRRPAPYAADEIARLVDFVAGLGPGPALPDVDPARGEAAAGGELFRRLCAACHGSDGRGGAMSEGENAPSTLPASPEVIAAAIRGGPGGMPAFGPDTLDARQLEALVAHTTALTEPERRGGVTVRGGGALVEGALAWLLGIGGLLLLCRWIASRPS